MRFRRSIICGFIMSILVIYLIFRKSNRTSIDLKALLISAIHASEKGGFEILRSKNNLKIRKKGMTKEGLEDKVTNADYNSHCSMVSTMKENFPSLVIISEESDKDCSDSKNTLEKSIDASLFNNIMLDYIDTEWVLPEDVTVWIDPLDATYEFTEKLYQYVSTMVCIALKGRPVIGVIHKPFQNTTSWAWIGKAKSSDLNSDNFQLPRNGPMRIAISRSHSGKIKEMIRNHLTDFEIEVAAGAGYKSLQVAHAEVDAYIHMTDLRKWDICAGNAIIEALGGKMTDKRNQFINYDKDSKTLNENGLIATLKNHSKYLGIF